MSSQSSVGSNSSDNSGSGGGSGSAGQQDPAVVSWLQFLVMKFDDAITQAAQLAKHYSMLYFNARRHESKALLRKYDQLAAVGLSWFWLSV